MIVNGNNGNGQVLASISTGAVIRPQGAPGALNATGALTAALILGGIVTSTTAAAVTATLPTGAVMDAAVNIEIGDAIEWTAINTGSNAFTVTAADDHTVVGAGAVAAGTSGRFLTRKTAANTFVTYRVLPTCRPFGAGSFLGADMKEFDFTLAIYGLCVLALAAYVVLSVLYRF